MGLWVWVWDDYHGQGRQGGRQGRRRVGERGEEERGGGGQETRMKVFFDGYVYLGWGWLVGWLLVLVRN
ncbi:hypothetical protein M0802_005883 [Mischocyttarus mexicanus]|nr:hypothetical protein M0802_005883 [Mischocyttarus mexicanus]